MIYQTQIAVKYETPVGVIIYGFPIQIEIVQNPTYILKKIHKRAQERIEKQVSKMFGSMPPPTNINCRCEVTPVKGEDIFKLKEAGLKGARTGKKMKEELDDKISKEGKTALG